MIAVRRRRWLWFAFVALILVAALFAAVMRSHNLDNQIMQADPEQILGQPKLASRALAIGATSFVANCSGCHGTGAGDPTRGIPNLADRDFLYGGGRVSEIEQIVLHGIRSGDPRGWHLAFMPAYGTPRPYAAEPLPSLSPREIRDVAQYLLSSRGKATDLAAAGRGAQLYAVKAGCWDCHERDGGGDSSIGAPSLIDDVWLYGDGSAAAIERSITAGRAGSSPAFSRRLTPLEARAIAVYVVALANLPSKELTHD
jgi:cytochrome c oxidase cbb3-type subunit 3